MVIKKAVDWKLPSCVITNSCCLKVLLFLFFIIQINTRVVAADIVTKETNETVSDSVDKEKTNEYRVAVQGGNNIIQNGKKMAKDEYYLQPSFNYSNNNGLYSGLSCVYLIANKKRPIDNFAINTGYDRDLSDNFSVGLDYTFSHYYSTKEIASSLPHTLTLEGSYYSKVISPAISAIYGFGNSSDFTTSLDLSHIFSIHNIFTTDDKLIIPLIVGTFAGTSNSYKNYTKKNIIKDKKGKTVNANDINSKFGLTSSYISTSIKYSISSFSFGISAIYSYPFNQSQKLSSSSLPVFKFNTALYF